VAGFDDTTSSLRADLTSYRFDSGAMVRSMLRQILSSGIDPALSRHDGMVVARGSTAPRSWPGSRGAGPVAAMPRTAKTTARDGVYFSPMPKTNACRILEGMGIEFATREYEVDPEDLSAESVAAKVGMPPEQVFKTLVVHGDRNGHAVAVVPGSWELDLKAMARATGDRKVDLVALKEVQPVTGYIRGGVTALGMKKSFPVVADETIQLWDKVCVSAGVRGTQIEIAPNDYLRATGAVIAEIARPK
jgi:Cys-tRNA(Pro)/Cys-tRNA(Cys) deacylase